MAGVKSSEKNFDSEISVVQSETVYADAFEFCRKYLGRKTLKLFEKGEKETEEKLSAFSALYKDLTTYFVKDIKKKDEIRSIIDGKRRNELNVVTDIDRAICSLVDYGIGRSGGERLLIINSPVGSYRNRLLKYIYLKLSYYKADSILPIYVDASYYESNRQELETDSLEISKLISKNKHLTPIFIIDNVRNFNCGMGEVYDILNTLFVDTDNAKLIVGVDYRFDEEMRERKKGEFVTNLINADATALALSISPMSLSRDESTEFIDNCIKLFRDEHDELKGKEIDASAVRKRLTELGLSYIDAYWLIRLIREYSLFTDKSTTISDLYSQIISKQIQGRLDEAALAAYEFGLDGKYDSSVDAKIWKLIREHKSVLDYLVALHYVKKLKDFDIAEFEKMSNEEKKKAFGFFNRVFPKSITRFATYMIKATSEIEEKLLQFADDKYYNNNEFFGVLAKSELTYWLGRLSDNHKEQAFNRLRELREQTIIEYEKIKDAVGEGARKEAKKTAFLLRGISVSLLYFREPNFKNAVVKVMNDYMKLLFTDKVCNEVNRAFHLEYYNDISYSLKEYSDKCILNMKEDEASLAKGYNTFRKIISDLDAMERYFDSVGVLQLVTLCNLILARKPEKIDSDASGHKCSYIKNLNPKERNNPAEFIKIYNIKEYIDKCHSIIENLEKSEIYNDLDNLAKSYFKWMKSELYWLNSEFEKAEKTDCVYFISYIETRSYNIFAKTQNIERTGWRQRGIKRAESVAEHMYNSWFMGLLCLPEKATLADEHDGYDKQSVLNMLLIHDVGECIMGDIPRDLKLLKKDEYKEKESDVLYSLLFTGAYPFVSESMSRYYDEWETWLNCENINAKIAKDIDNIQATYQYCRFYLRKDKNRYLPKDKIYVLNGDGERVSDIGAMGMIPMDEEDCYNWLAKIDVDSKLCELKSCRGREMSSKIIFENIEFADIIDAYYKQKRDAT